jgi:hypothetical protein
MAKRTRYSDRTTARPGARRADRAISSVRGPQTPRPVSDADDPIPVDLPDDAPMLASRSGLTATEVDRAAELEAEVTAREKAAIAESLRRRQRTDAGGSHLAGDLNQPLSVRAAHEYAYVARDVRRFLLTGGLMIAILATIYVLFNLMAPAAV